MNLETKVSQKFLPDELEILGWKIKAHTCSLDALCFICGFLFFILGLLYENHQNQFKRLVSRQRFAEVSPWWIDNTWSKNNDIQRKTLSQIYHLWFPFFDFLRWICEKVCFFTPFTMKISTTFINFKNTTHYYTCNCLQLEVRAFF